MKTRRSLILGSVAGTVVPTLVRATSLVDVPGDPLAKHGLRAAEQWATESFREMPACRLVFASGYTHRWFEYQNVSRAHPTDATQRDYAVALEVAITDAEGRRFVSSHPVDGVRLQASVNNRIAKQVEAWDQAWGSPF